MQEGGMHRSASASSAAAGSDSIGTAPSSSVSSRTFSTRFLQSDGIPEYNALLDTHLGKRREYLLGNRKSLELLQQTGVVARVQTHDETPNQYVVYMAEKPIHRRKRLPPPSLPRAALLSESPAPWKQSSHRHIGLRKSETTPQLAAGRSRFERHHLNTSTSHGTARGESDDDVADSDDEWGRGDVSTSMAFHERRSTTTNHAVAKARRATGAELTPVHSGSGVRDKLSTVKRLGRSMSASTIAQRRYVTLNDGDSTSGSRSRHPEIPSVQSDDTVTANDNDDDATTTIHLGCRSESVAPASTLRARSKSVVAVAARRELADTALLRSGGGAGVVGAATETASRGSQSQSQSQPQHPLKKPPRKGAVQHLLESDASYMAQIRVMREQLADLDGEKTRLDGEVVQLRKRLRGVNAVHENDVAVAHCSSIMQHRLSKAEEEYMKLLTAQAHMRRDVDRVRRELGSLKTVRKKLAADIDAVRHVNAAVADRIRAVKATRNVVSAELVELEKKAELAIEEQRLSLPPEEAVVVDVATLMCAVQARTVNRRRRCRVASRPSSSAACSPAHTHQQLSPSSVGGASAGHQLSQRATAEAVSASKPRVRYETAFQVIQHTLGCRDLAAFVDRFVDVEEQLLSTYTATLALEDERNALQRELETLLRDTAARHASARGSHDAAITQQNALQRKVRVLLARIESYNALREARNGELVRVRGIMQRCLEVLQAETLLQQRAQAAGIGGPMLMSELPAPALLEALQKKMTEVAVVMKMRHSAAMLEGPKRCFHATAVGRDGNSAHRSSMFATREVSRIVLGPREPAGSALAAILGTVQAPSIEAALALTEKNSIESNHSAICAADMASPCVLSSRRLDSAKSASTGTGASRAGGDMHHGGGNVDDIDNDIDNEFGPSSHPTIEDTRRRSSRRASTGIGTVVVFPVRARPIYEEEHEEAEEEVNAQNADGAEQTRDTASARSNE